MDSTYAPQSPDLSSFFTSPAKTQQHSSYQQHITSHSTSSYTPQSPTLPSFNNNPAVQQQQHQQQQSPPTSVYNHNTIPQDNHYSQPPHPFTESHSFANSSAIHPKPYSNFGGGRTVGSNYDDHFEPSNLQYQIPDLPPQQGFPPQRDSQTYYAPPPQSYSESPQSYTNPHQPAYLRSEDTAFSASSLDNNYISPISNINPPASIMSRRGPGKQPPPYENQFQQIPPPQPVQPLLRDPNPTNIQITTKFPTARIKRIMQADEEVGKVAQVTPPAVNKALELFMIALVTGAADKAKEKGGKRITAQHLKQVVLGDEQFDFLAEIVGRVEEGKEDGKEGGRKRKGKKEEGSDSSDEAGEKKKKGKGGRKKKNADE